MLAYLRLLRIANVFTVVADTTAAYLLVHRSLEPAGNYLGLLIAGMLLYSAGMVLNDLFDLDQDRRERPERPLPSGRISLGMARILGFGLLIAGVVAAAIVGWVASSPRTTVLALLLAGAIVSYDIGLKRTVLGGPMMGACRGLNLLMAMSTVSATNSLSFPPAGLAFALGITVYVCGITWFARTEAVESRRGGLILGNVTMALGFVILGSASFIDPDWQARLAERNPWFWPGLLALVAVTVLRRGVNAIGDRSPVAVQTAVKQAILTLIVIDASVCLFVLPEAVYYALFVLTLLAPTLWLGRWVRST